MTADTELYYEWRFTLDDGSTIVAKFKDSEILKLAEECPNVKWYDLDKIRAS